MKSTKRDIVITRDFKPGDLVQSKIHDRIVLVDTVKHDTFSGIYVYGVNNLIGNYDDNRSISQYTLYRGSVTLDNSED